jgi:threonine/homoserine/homoserine lactone efflux protein
MVYPLYYLGRVAAVQGDLPTAHAFFKESLALFEQLDDQRSIATCLEGWARVVAQQGAASWAAQLWGAAEVRREVSGSSDLYNLFIMLDERADDERMRAMARAQLGAQAFAQALADGRAMSPAQVLSAQEHTLLSSHSHRASPGSGGGQAGACTFSGSGEHSSRKWDDTHALHCSMIYAYSRGKVIMLTWSTIVLFSLAALGLLLIPGPSVVYIVTRSAVQGRRAGLASVLGIELAGLIHAVAAALGLSALLLSSALAFSVVKYLGAAYLIYLGIRTLLTRQKPQQTAVVAPKSCSQLFFQGFLVDLLNPKTALFFYAFLPQFVDPARGAVPRQMLLLGILFELVGICTDSLYALLSSVVGKFLTSNAFFQRIQRYITGCVYITLGIFTAVTGSEKK